MTITYRIVLLAAAVIIVVVVVAGFLSLSLDEFKSFGTNAQYFCGEHNQYINSFSQEEILLLFGSILNSLMCFVQAGMYLTLQQQFSFRKCYLQTA